MSEHLDITSECFHQRLVLDRMINGYRCEACRAFIETPKATVGGWNSEAVTGIPQMIEQMPPNVEVCETINKVYAALVLDQRKLAQEILLPIVTGFDDTLPRWMKALDELEARIVALERLLVPDGK